MRIAYSFSINPKLKSVSIQDGHGACLDGYQTVCVWAYLVQAFCLCHIMSHFVDNSVPELIACHHKFNLNI